MRERKRSASSESIRERAEARRARRRAEEARRREAESREAAIRKALARPVSPEDAVARFLVAAPDGSAAEKRSLLLRAVAAEAPRLVAEDMIGAVAQLAEPTWLRGPSSWSRSGKGRDALFRSLAEHLFARYPMPPFLWTAFFGDAEDARVLGAIAAEVAGGGSLFKAVEAGRMPVPLTRRMCHEVMTSRAESRFLDVVRRVQARAVGVDDRLFRAWMATRAGGRLHDRAGETFWQTVLAWLGGGAGTAPPPADVGPIVDYVAHRRAADAGFSIRGRSLGATTRAMRRWHDELAREKAIRGVRFEPSGYQPLDLDRSRRSRTGERLKEIWRVREVADDRTLADEGRAMGHCVYSYAPSVERRECSIWTLTLENDTGHWRQLTVEVRASDRRIVQARGRFNRMPEPREMLVLNAWAAKNELQVGV